MAKIKIHLFGKHSHRTPLSYPVYQRLFSPYVEFVDDINHADVVASGTFTDFRRNARELAALEHSPRFLVLSEEPYWDVCWDPVFEHRHGDVSKGDSTVVFQRVNHTNSAIYSFAHLPYYITTDNDFYARYAWFFKRNATLRAKDWLAHWQQCRYREAYLVERRLEEKHLVDRPDLDMWSYSVLRTQLAERVFTFDNSGDGLVAGFRWRDDVRRQKLPDWHLDKIQMLDGRVQLINALENTHQRDYVSEKLFDGFALQGIPIYAATPDHSLFRLLSNPACINVFGHSFEQAAEAIDNFETGPEFAENYTENQQQLLQSFSQPWQLHEERARIVREVVKVLYQL